MTHIKLHSKARRNILIVDDEVEVRDAVGEFVTASLDDVRVFVADSGPAALEILARQPIHLILTDYNMPGMNGLQFLAAAKKLRPGIPHILITAYFGDALGQMGDDMRDSLVLQKPFVPDGLLHDIEAALSVQAV